MTGYEYIKSLNQEDLHAFLCGFAHLNEQEIEGFKIWLNKEIKEEQE